MGATMLHGRRIKLRAIEEADLPLVAEWRSRPEVYAFFYEWEPLSLRQQRAWYERQLGSASEKNFMVALPDGKAIGICSLVHIDARNRRAEYGRWLMGDKNSQGAGLGVDAEVLLLRYAFEHLNLNRVDCEVLATNASVLETQKGLGFRQEGVKRQFVYKAGAYLDVVLLSLLREEYDREVAEGQLGRMLRGLT